MEGNDKLSGSLPEKYGDWRHPVTVRIAEKSTDLLVESVVDARIVSN
jgi:hypothetical protein